MRLVHLQTHAVVDLVVGQGDVVLEDARPLLELDLLGRRSDLGCDELLEIADRVLGRALDSDCEHKGGGAREEGGRVGGRTPSVDDLALKDTEAARVHTFATQSVVCDDLDHGPTNRSEGKREGANVS